MAREVAGSTAPPLELALRSAWERRAPQQPETVPDKRTTVRFRIWCKQILPHIRHPMKGKGCWGLDWVTFRGPFQPKPLCESVFSTRSQGLEIKRTLCTCLACLLLLHVSHTVYNLFTRVE